VVRGARNEMEGCVIKYTPTAAVSEIPDSCATEKDSAPQESQRLLLLTFSTATRRCNGNANSQEILIIPPCT
jgi:hypothetical protein